MKKIGIAFAIVAIVTACNNSDQSAGNNVPGQNAAVKDSSNYTTVQWLDSTFSDLGKVKEGQVVEVAFRFKNNGNKNLVISDVSAGCGCTIPEKPSAPYTPGQEGVIRAKFNSENRVGINRKEIYVTANTNPNIQTLAFRVEVTE
ncbi:MAG: DUF1573 domain-containing protein [Chitinophagaceae bacterium]|jgi:hypothetical protein|nr:DUF1573 domain-containing protein [Chitinophagaceae bacterium]OQY95504.1 MAG: hypothetical protein B6D37_05785 [Sphingobacteriales bacterium UTBCD1]